MLLKRVESVCILIVEGDQPAREFLTGQLTDRGYKVMTADNGLEAVECVKNSKFDVVISDHRIPGMDGLEMLEAINKADPEAQVIMTGNHATVEIAVSAMKKGAFHFLQKPLMMNKLFSTLEEALQKKGLKLEGVLEGVMDRLQRFFHADESSFMLMDKNNRLYIACSRGLSEEIVYTTMLKIGERVAGIAAEKGREFLIIGGLDQHPEFRGIEGHPRIRSSIVIPVYCQRKFLGVLNLNRTEYLKNFTKKDLKKVSLFATQIAQAVQDAQRREALEARRRHEVILKLLNPPAEKSPS